MLLAGMAGAALAQPQQKKDMRMKNAGTPEQRAERQTSRMEQTLQLSAEQKQSIYSANLDAARKMEPYVSNMKENRQAIREIQQAKDAQYKNVLNADQYRQYEQMKAERRSKMGARHGGAHKGAAPVK